MAIGRLGAVRGPLKLLFDAGAVGDLTDGQLLERFLARDDGSEAAFAALVDRHGRMVSSVCRQALGASHDAEDAFQATFLILVRRAGSIRRRDSIGSWLYGVARRVSARARDDAARRRIREHRAGREFGETATRTLEPGDDPVAALIEEIARLPEKYRQPVLLCDLGGQTHAQAACQLNWPIGTVSGRLSRARALLRSRLVRRGAVGAAATLAAFGRPFPVAAALVEATAKAAVALAAGMPIASGFSAGATGLAGAVLGASSVGRLKAMAGLLLAAGVASGTVLPGRIESRTATSRPSPAPTATTTTATAPPAEVRRSPAHPPAYLGQHGDEVTATALAPDGKTLASGSRDAVVRLWDVATRRERATLRGHSAPILALTFSDDSASLASADADRNLKVWDVPTGRERLALSLLGPASPAGSPESPESDPELGRLSQNQPDPGRPDCGASSGA